MLVIKQLHKSYENKPILKGIDFAVAEGEFICLIGASGSGKTTLFRCLALQERWDRGQYLYKGNDLVKLNPLARWWQRRDWAYIEEKAVMNPNKTALQNILASRTKYIPFWRRLIGKPGVDEHVFAMDYLEKVGLLEQAKRKTGKLSGGEKQRVAIAKSLVQGAQIVFTDEPVSGLDPRSAERVMQDLKRMNEQQKVTVLCIMHQVDLAEKFADRILGMADGKIVLDVRGRRLTGHEKRSVIGIE